LWAAGYWFISANLMGATVGLSNRVHALLDKPAVAPKALVVEVLRCVQDNLLRQYAGEAMPWRSYEAWGKWMELYQFCRIFQRIAL
jgi:hypothetical protein